ncbi:MAG: hypothetical protein QNK03_10290, partial [Myxococcota bacterium]|nr:hypothetical protein [Myxococcota bacterium]
VDFGAPCQGGASQWVRIPPGDWSLQPVALGAAVEVTKLSKPSIEEIASGDLGEQAGRNVSER